MVWCVQRNVIGIHILLVDCVTNLFFGSTPPYEFSGQILENGCDSYDYLSELCVVHVPN
jgi:hypothetical protein